MSWLHWLTDARTGLVVRPVDIPSFTWEMTVSDFGFSTTDKNTGDTTVSSVSIPWSQFDAYDSMGVLVHRATPAEIASMLSMGRRGLCSAWMFPGCADPRGLPVLWGALGEREDKWAGTTFPLYSPMTLMASRYAIRDGRFVDGTSTDTVSYTGLSLRGVASELGSLATEQKNGGQLPIRWTYRGETGNHQRTDYQAWNVQNLSVKKLLTDIGNVQNGPDMTFRPRWSDDTHVTVDFLAGSDADVYLDMDHQPIVLNVSQMDDPTVDYALPYQRVYGTGAGTDASVITALAEDLSQVTSSTDPPILREMAYGDTDAANVGVLKPKVQALLDGNKAPLMQLTCSIDLDDVDADGRPLHPLGSFWPGELFHVDIYGFRSIPDDRYSMRLMRMSGDQSSKVTLTFDVTNAPF